MILHSIWIREFRNLRNQLINLTGKYYLRTDLDAFTIYLNENTIPNNFFGKSITSVSGIIGENGAGKTNVLELINFLLFNPRSVDSNFIMVYEENNSHENEIIIAYNFELDLKKIIYPKNKSIFKPLKIDEFARTKIKSIYFTNLHDGINKKLPKETIDLTYKPNRFELFQNSFKREIDFFKTDYPTILNFNVPNRITIRPHINSYSVSRLNEHIFHEEMNSIRSKIINYSSKKSLVYWFVFYLAFKILDDYFKYTDIEKKTKSSVIFGKQRIEVKNYLQKIIKKKQLENIIESLIKEMPHFLYKEKYQIIVENISSKSSEFQIEAYQKDGRYMTRDDYYIVSYDNNFRKFYNFFVINYPCLDKFTFGWFGLSTGQRSFLRLYSKILAAKKQISEQNLIICIDEGDLTFHPQWQKEFVFNLLAFLNNAFPKNMIQVVLTSHSPFIVSDIPKESLTFLGENEESIIEIGETFGANILDLYNKAFFLKNGTLGHFSESKVKEIISLIFEKLKKNENIEPELSQIGDPLILNQIKYFKREFDAKASDNK